LKSKGRKKCKYYRPISILPIISKIFERSVFNQLYEFLNANNLLYKYQFGFCPKYSTLAALIQMCDAWYENMDNGELNGVVFIDIRKAFDSINHNILLRKSERSIWDFKY
jgi:sarcosine oxidase/L-pipecolate oxidase